MKYRSDKRAVLKIFVVCLIILNTTPSLAATNKTNKSFLGQVSEVFNSLKNYIQQFSDEFSQGWGELSGDVQRAINSSIGDLGIPDPILAGKKIKVVVSKQKTDIAVTDPRLQGQNAQREWHTLYTLGESQAKLGKEGQKTAKQNAEISNDALKTSSDNADAAQNDIVTQDILKKVAVQNAQQAVIFKSIQGEEQQQTQVLTTANINLADISGHMNEQARRQQLSDNATAKQILESAAFADGFWQKKSSNN